MMKKISIALLVLSPLLNSCLKDDKSALFFEIKSGSNSFQGRHIDIPTNSFSFDSSPATYKNVLRHIFQDKCIRCHSSETTKLGVNLSLYNKVFDMSDYFSPVVVANDPESSGVYLEVESGRMPPRETLSTEEIAFIKRWIKEGAVE